jgi:hypothetical protein
LYNSSSVGFFGAVKISSVPSVCHLITLYILFLSLS